MDEIRETKNTGFNFLLDLPETYFGSGKYPTLQNIRKTSINKDQLIIRISLVATLLLCSTLANGQLADSTLYKVKLEKFNTQVRNSRIITIVGLSAIVIGGVTSLVEYSSENENDVLLFGGYGLFGAGVVTSFVGAINWSVGKRKIREYQIRLDDVRTGFYFNPKSVGVTLAFKF